MILGQNLTSASTVYFVFLENYSGYLIFESLLGREVRARIQRREVGIQKKQIHYIFPGNSMSLDPTRSCFIPIFILKS